MHMENQTILIIDDDLDLVDMLSMFLTKKHLNIITAYHADQIPQDLSDIDLILLDINLPKNDGFHICHDIRQHWNMPILFLSARMNEQDKIRGLMLGGDDYITKPFSLEELYARIYTNLNRSHREIRSNDHIQVSEGTCLINDTKVNLTKYEYQIIELLFLNPHQVFSKERIYDIVWGIDSLGSPQVVSEHIRNIRNKFSKLTQHDYIETRWGIGYTWAG